ncbi:hypothetical protein DCAR_0624662 [Daucus carota subsp. sativus]|uniref:Uncharacterized protein n=1 Tax=Daucus carota subsp. sativus TaxID=79200 RepID=A0A164VYY9_DAUCS|nr:hypothetical protein DCAR_0624662 [Daucus carota subsp. sativus]
MENIQESKLTNQGDDDRESIRSGEGDVDSMTTKRTRDQGGRETLIPSKGIGILLSGLFGTGNESSVSIENAGLLALTRVGKFGAVFASIPSPIFAALYCLFFAYVGAAGVSFLQFCNLNSFRTKFILGFSVFLGFSIPQYYWKMHIFWTTHYIRKTVQSERTEANTGGTSSGHTKLTQEVRNSTHYPLDSINIFPQRGSQIVDLEGALLTYLMFFLLL